MCIVQFKQSEESLEKAVEQKGPNAIPADVADAKDPAKP